MTNSSEIKNIDIRQESLENYQNAENQMVRAAGVTENDSLQVSSSKTNSEVLPVSNLQDEQDFYKRIGKKIVDEMPEIDSENSDQKDVFSALEKGIVLAALEKTKGNKRAASKLLGLYRPRLYNIIKRHNIKN
jgi:transcriptional regulator with PAS, ATPase and Fis domain